MSKPHPRSFIAAARAAASVECLTHDMAELASALSQSGRALVRLDAAIMINVLDQIERDDAAEAARNDENEKGNC